MPTWRTFSEIQLQMMKLKSSTASIEEHAPAGSLLVHSPATAPLRLAQTHWCVRDAFRGSC